MGVADGTTDLVDDEVRVDELLDELICDDEELLNELVREDGDELLRIVESGGGELLEASTDKLDEELATFRVEIGTLKLLDVV